MADHGLVVWLHACHHHHHHVPFGVAALLVHCLCVCVMAKAWWLVLHFVVAWWPCGCPVCACCCWLVALGVWVWLNSGTWLWCCTLCHHVASLGDCCLSTVIVVVLVTRLFGQPFPHHLLCPHPPLSFLLHPRLSLSLCVWGMSGGLMDVATLWP